jgi:hypothetical protein
MITINYMTSFHDRVMADHTKAVTFSFGRWDTQFTYTFENFFHPFVGELIAKLNRGSLSSILDAKWQASLSWLNLNQNPDSPPPEEFDAAWTDSIRQDAIALKYHNYFRDLYSPTENRLVQVNYFPKEIDVSKYGPYANYNWELFFHIPLTIAAHLSKTQRFAEAQRWFHYIFDPTSTDRSVGPPKRFWKFLAFRKGQDNKTIDDIVRILSRPRSALSPAEQSLQDEILSGYYAILTKPFQPHAAARARPLAYQYCVVMKYLDNLIAWGDNLFQQDTVESINEATQIYVLAANILGERPQEIPALGKVKAKSFAQLKKDGLGPIGDALVDLEGQFPFNLANPNSATSGVTNNNNNALFGMGRTLCFCIPRNDKLLGYWDTVADRLFKIRHCMNIAGVVRPLPLFDPPIDPGMLVKAAAAGVDIGSIVSGLNQPIGPVRCLFLIQKALELCNEVRNLGNALLSAFEKSDAEHLALIRQRHEIQIQEMAQEVRFLQFKAAQEATTSLLTSRATVLERLNYYKRLLNIANDPNAPDKLTIEHSEKPDDPPKLTEENFDEVYNDLVGQYDKTLTHYDLPKYTPVGGDSPTQQAGAAGQGQLYLNSSEDAELNTHLPKAQDARFDASGLNMIASTITFVPDAKVHGHYWGIGVSETVTGGQKLAIAAKMLAEIAQVTAALEQDRAGMASRKASYQRRADEWLFQYNLASHELMQIGRQILTSLIAEQIAHHEYRNIKQQIANSQEVDQYLQDKFTNEDLYLWMQGEISRIYCEYYRFAFDTGRKAERTMKQELMRPEVDGQDFVKFNYWDGGRKGLLSGEALYLDVKRMEMAYHDNNKRELELTKHVSLRQLNPIALLTLKAGGTCQVTIPEWLYDLECPGHYMRRIKSVSLSIPSVVGPYTSVNCTLSLLKSSVRKSPIGDDYLRQGSEDDRFVDYVGAVQSIVTSTAQSDSGMFETNLRDERYLPFEGAGAESTWKLELPTDFRQFDYNTISDAILHVRYTARQGGAQLRDKAVKQIEELVREANTSELALLFSLRHDFPTEWHRFVTGTNNFVATIRRDHFPYLTQGRAINIDTLQVHAIQGSKLESVIPQGLNLPQGLNAEGVFEFSLVPDGTVLIRNKDANVFILTKYSVGSS